MAYSAVGSDPNVSVVILKQRTRAEVAQSVALLIIRKTPCMPAAHSFVGCNPDAAILPLDKGAYEVVDQPVLGHVPNQLRTVLPEDTSAFGSDPESAIPVAENIANTHAADSWKADEHCFTVMKAKQIRRRDPKVAIVILIDSFGVIVAGVR